MNGPLSMAMLNNQRDVTFVLAFAVIKRGKEGKPLKNVGFNMGISWNMNQGLSIAVFVKPAG